MKYGLLKNKEGYYFISESGIRYTLLEGMTIGGDKRYASDTMILFLDTYGNLKDESAEKFADKFGNMRFLVDYFQMGGEPNESEIRECVIKFEEKNVEMISYIIKERTKRMEISENEYREMKTKISQLESSLDLAMMELHTYRMAIKEMANRNLDIDKKQPYYGIEIPARDFSDLIDKMTLDWMENSSGCMDTDKFRKMEATDLWFVWNGICARIPYGCEICDKVLPAIKEAYEEYNS